MEDYDTKVLERLNFKDSDLSNQVNNVDCWNKLSIADQDPEFLEGLDLVISELDIPDGPDDAINNKIGKIIEAPTTVPGIHYQEVVPSEEYANM